MVYVKHDFDAWDKTTFEKNPLEIWQALPSLEISNKGSNVISRGKRG